MADTMKMETKENLTHSAFRRSSIQDNGVMKLETDRIPTILLQMGQPFSSTKLDKFILKLDPEGTGMIDMEGYKKVCKEFVKNPAALAKYEGDEFSFKHLIGKGDFAAPP